MLPLSAFQNGFSIEHSGALYNVARNTYVAKTATAFFEGFKEKHSILTILKATFSEKYHCLSSISSVGWSIQKRFNVFSFLKILYFNEPN